MNTMDEGMQSGNPILTEVQNVTIDNLNYLLANGEATVTGFDVFSDNIYIPETVEYDGIEYTVTSVGDKAFEYSNITSIWFPDSITALGNRCFAECWCLTSVDLPESITFLGEECFRKCLGLTSINLPNSITYLGDACFCQCPSLASIVLPDSLTYLGEYCFDSCTNLYSVTCWWKDLGKMTIGSDVFDGIASDSSLYVLKGKKSLYEGKNPWNDFKWIKDFYVTFDGIKYSLSECTALILRQDESLSGDIVIPKTFTFDGMDYMVTNMAYNAFENTNITSIKLPDSIPLLKDNCFAHCSSLTSIDIPNSVISLGKMCFAFCSDLSSIDLPNSIATIGDSCFAFCDSLTSVDLPDGITSLGKWCFTSCSSLKSINLPKNVIYLGAYCFSSCSSLTSIEFPRSITAFGDSCFSGCFHLTSIDLPSNITSLGSACFSSCSRLSSIHLPANITSLGNYCFYHCSSLSKVFCEWKDLDNLKVGEAVFKGINPDCTLYIPKGTETVYNETEPWCNFK